LRRYKRYLIGVNLVPTSNQNRRYEASIVEMYLL